MHIQYSVTILFEICTQMGCCFSESCNKTNSSFEHGESVNYAKSKKHITI